MTNSRDFPAYLADLIRLGHGRDWVRRNEPALRERFARDQAPFPPPPEPVRVRDRYEEI